jgi:hypothetical protein
MENRSSVLLSIFVLLLLALLTWYSARTGYAALLTTKVASVNDLPRVAKAVRLNPSDPQTHVLLGALLEVSNDRAAANSQYQTAVSLRPDDYVLRLQLARGQELAGDTAGAIASASTAVKLAPFYSQPHWQLGNILVRAERHEGGFSELRLAAASKSTLWPSIVDLAWQISGGNVEYVLAAMQPHTPDAYKALAVCFKKHGEHRAAIKMLVAGGEATLLERRAYVGELITEKQFFDARFLWSGEHGHGPDPDMPETLIDGGFEAETNLDEPGFSWRAAGSDKTITLSLDNTKPQEGRTSLRVDFNGATNPDAEVISQLVLVSPKTSYRLYFAVRTDGLVSGGLPNVTVVDASDSQLFGQTGALPQNTNGWQPITIKFTTGASTTAIQISLRRQPCPAPQCPIFGKLWLDEFILRGPEYVGEG